MVQDSSIVSMEPWSIVSKHIKNHIDTIDHGS